MKKCRIMRACLAACLVFGTAILPADQMTVQAAEAFATVRGNVMSGTTAELLRLSTLEGEMQIKIDSTTDTSACKILLPNKAVNVSVAHGSDGYLHAVKITNETKAPAVSLDSSSSATVVGTIGENSNDEVLYFKTVQGDMEIKIDANTNMSGCSFLMVDKTYKITCVRGSDAYMHAVTIEDAAAGSVGTADSIAAAPGVELTPSPASPVTVSTSPVTGTVSESTKENLLYLSTSAGEMQIVIDANTDSRSGFVLTPGRRLSVAVYRGSDAYMHAATIVGVKDPVIPVQLNSSTSTVTGTVGSKTTENMLYLTTSAGEMQLKTDTLNSISNCKVLVAGKRITITCARGTDAYMHVISITGA